MYWRVSKTLQSLCNLSCFKQNEEKFYDENFIFLSFLSFLSMIKFQTKHTVLRGKFSMSNYFFKRHVEHLNTSLMNQSYFCCYLSPYSFYKVLFKHTFCFPKNYPFSSICLLTHQSICNLYYDNNALLNIGPMCFPIRKYYKRFIFIAL